MAREVSFIMPCHSMRLNESKVFLKVVSTLAGPITRLILRETKIHCGLVSSKVEYTVHFSNTRKMAYFRKLRLT